MHVQFVACGGTGNIHLHVTRFRRSKGNVQHNRAGIVSIGSICCGKEESVRSSYGIGVVTVRCDRCGRKRSVNGIENAGCSGHCSINVTLYSRCAPRRAVVGKGEPCRCLTIEENNDIVSRGPCGLDTGLGKGSSNINLEFERSRKGSGLFGLRFSFNL